MTFNGFDGMLNPTQSFSLCVCVCVCVYVSFMSIGCMYHDRFVAI